MTGRTVRDPIAGVWHGECARSRAEVMLVDLDTLLAVLRVYAGLVLAGHGAQKVLGWYGGQGLGGVTGMVGKIGFRPPGAWALVLGWGELAGGLLLAVGFLTGIVAAVLFVDMLVAIWKVHSPKGFWVTGGGYEYALTLAVIFAAFGLAGPGAYSLDGALGIAALTTPLFLATTVLGLLAVWGGTRPEARLIEREAGRRRGRVA